MFGTLKHGLRVCSCLSVRSRKFLALSLLMDQKRCQDRSLWRSSSTPGHLSMRKQRHEAWSSLILVKILKKWRWDEPAHLVSNLLSTEWMTTTFCCAVLKRVDLSAWDVQMQVVGTSWMQLCHSFISQFHNRDHLATNLHKHFVHLLNHKAPTSNAYCNKTAI